MARACTGFAVSLAVVIAVLACATDRKTTEPDPVERPVVDRLAEQSVRLRWPAAFSSGSVAIFAGLSPDAIDRTRPLAVASGGSVTLTTSDLPEIDDDYRLYYELTPESGAPPLITAERRLPLQGPDNFRDLGGYATADGRRVRWGRLYRSNDLSGLTRDDLEYLSRIGLKLVCDFRSDRERREKPDRAIEPEPPLSLDLPVDAEGVDPGALQEKIRTGGIAALGTEKLMRTAYRSFVSDHSARWAVMLRRLAQPEVSAGARPLHRRQGPDGLRRGAGAPQPRGSGGDGLRGLPPDEPLPRGLPALRAALGAALLLLPDRAGRPAAAAGGAPRVPPDLARCDR